MGLIINALRSSLWRTMIHCVRVHVLAIAYPTHAVTFGWSLYFDVYVEADTCGKLALARSHLGCPLKAV